MKILVCVKQVPDMEALLTIDDDGKWINDRDLAFRMNEYDEYAVEQSVLIKEQLGGSAEITILSIGPARVTEVLKKSLAMGADRGVHVRDDEVRKKDPWQIADTIAAYARGLKFDLIFTGMQSQDRGSAQVGVFIAERLGYPCVTTAIGFTLDGAYAHVVRELEGGVRMRVKVTLPAVVTCQLGMNQPRYPTLPNIMKARQKELKVTPIADLLHEEPMTTVERIFSPEKRTDLIVLTGEVPIMVDHLMTILKEKTAVLRSVGGGR